MHEFHIILAFISQSCHNISAVTRFLLRLHSFWSRLLVLSPITCIWVLVLPWWSVSGRCQLFSAICIQHGIPGSVITYSLTGSSREFVNIIVSRTLMKSSFFFGLVYNTWTCAKVTVLWGVLWPRIFSFMSCLLVTLHFSCMNWCCRGRKTHYCAGSSCSGVPHCQV